MNKKILYLIFLIFNLESIYATDIWIKLSKHGARINLGILSFLPEKPDIEQAKTGREISDIVKYDLLFTKCFNIIEPQPTPDMSQSKQNYYNALNNQGIEVLLKGTINIREKNCQVEITLEDTLSTEVILKKSFTGLQENYRYIAHTISDELILRFTGEKGIAHTKIVFVNDQTGAKEIYVVDYDGYNLKRLTNDNSINIFPRWSPDSKKIIYTSYKNSNPDLWIMDHNGKNKKPISTYQGLNTCASWAPNGQTIILTLSCGKTPNIYQIDLSGNILRQITFGNIINTSPCFSPNNKELVFVSGKPEYPQMYITDIFGTKPRRIYTQGYSDSPMWSSKGDKIVFSMRQKDNDFFDIYLYDLVKDQFFQLTHNSNSNENPCFSPDGRYIVFTTTRNSRKKELFIMYMDGTGQKKLLDIQGSCFMPNWSN